MNRDRRIANALLLIYGFLSLGALSLPLSGPVRLFRACVHYLISPGPYLGAAAADRLAALPADVAHLIAADAENRRLREDLKRLEWLDVRLEACRRELARLKETVGMKPERERILRWASVAERDPANWHRSLAITAGKEDGVEINSPVLGLARGRFGVVGRITEVGERWSKVLLLGDEMSSVAAYLPAHQWEGLVEGQGGARLRMNYLPADARFAIGDSVHTSATSAAFPPDVSIGSVVRVFQKDPFLTFQSVEVLPTVDPRRLKEVAVLMPQKIAGRSSP